MNPSPVFKQRSAFYCKNRPLCRRICLSIVRFLISHRKSDPRCHSLSFLKHKKEGQNNMNYTSAEANKLLKKLNDEYTALLDKETRSRDFRAAMGEDVASVRPVYDYAETQARLAALEEKIRRLKHAINCFNTTHFVDGFDMTIDEMLVYIPQLTRLKNKLLEMKSRLPKERVEEQYGRPSNIIDYRYANYDIAAVEADYEKTADELSRAQLALDAVNGRETFEFGE